MPRALRQGDVWLTQFEVGWERPAIIVSRPELNRGNTVLVVPCSSSGVAERAISRNHVFLPSGLGGLTRDSVAQAHLVEPVDIAQLIHRMGALDLRHLSDVLMAIAWSIGLFDTTGHGPL